MRLKDYGTVGGNIDFEEKVEYNNPKSWLKSVSAFANTDGGILLFGIRNVDGEAVGLVDIVKDSEMVSVLIDDRIKPIPRYELRTFEENGKYFLEVKVGSGPKTPYYYDSDGIREAFIRVGNKSILASKIY